MRRDWTGWFWETRHTMAIVALAGAVGACQTDAPAAPEYRTVLSDGPNAAKVTETVRTDIIPAANTAAGGTVWGRAWAINEAGVVAGHRFVVPNSTIPAENNLFLWKDGEFTLYPLDINPIAINRKEEIAGNSTGIQLPFDSPGGAVSATNRALYWKNGVVTDLGTLGGTRSVATDINEKGQIVGHSRLAGSTDNRAFIWQDGVMTNLGTLGGASSVAYGINDRGQVVGNSTTASGQSHAFLWENGTMTDLGAFSAYAINDRGQVAGLQQRVDPRCGPAPVNLPIVWDRGVITNVDLFGIVASVCISIVRVWDISDAGHVLGVSTFSTTKPWVWRDGSAVVLNAAGDVGAFRINSSGETAGFALQSVFFGGVYKWSVGRHGP